MTTPRYVVIFPLNSIVSGPYQGCVRIPRSFSNSADAVIYNERGKISSHCYPTILITIFQVDLMVISRTSPMWMRPMLTCFPMCWLFSENWVSIMASPLHHPRIIPDTSAIGQLWNICPKYSTIAGRPRNMLTLHVIMSSYTSI